MTNQINAYDLQNALAQRDRRGNWSYGYDLPEAVREALACTNCGGAIRYGSTIIIRESTATVRHYRCHPDQVLRQSAPQADAQRHTWLSDARHVACACGAAYDVQPAPNGVFGSDVDFCRDCGEPINGEPLARAMTIADAHDAQGWATVKLVDGAYRVVWQDGSMEPGRFATHLLAELEIVRLKNLYPSLRTP